MGRLTLLVYKLFILSLFLGQLPRLPLPEVAGAVFVNDFLLVILILLWLTWRLLKKKSFWIDLPDASLYIFLAVLLLSLLFAKRWVGKTGLLVGFFYWIRLVMYVLIFPITRDLMKWFKQDFGMILELVAILFAVLGLLQFAIFPDFSRFVQHGWDPHYYRVLSTFFDPNFAGLFLVFGLLYLLYKLYTQTSRGVGFKFRLFVEILVIGLAAVLTFSRSTYLAAGVGLTVFALLKDKRLLFAMAVLGLLVFVSLPRVQQRVVGAIKLDTTTRLRLLDYQRTWQIAKDNLILGVGFNTFRQAQSEYGFFRDQRGVNQPGGHAGAGADNSFLFVLATSGLVGLSSLLGVISVFIYFMWGSRAKSLLLGSSAALFTHTQFINSLFYPWILAWILIISAIYLYHGNN